MWKVAPETFLQLRPGQVVCNGIGSPWQSPGRPCWQFPGKPRAEAARARLLTQLTPPWKASPFLDLGLGHTLGHHFSSLGFVSRFGASDLTLWSLRPSWHRNSSSPQTYPIPAQCIRSRRHPSRRDPSGFPDHPEPNRVLWLNGRSIASQKQNQPSCLRTLAGVQAPQSSLAGKPLLPPWWPKTSF